MKSCCMLAAFLALAELCPAAEPELEKLRYHSPGLAVDLGVGLWAWPVPMDADGDGDLDLIVVCPDFPSNGVWLFENPQGKVKFPVFKPARKLSKGAFNITPSNEGGKVRVLGPGVEYPDFQNSGLDKPLKLNLQTNVHPNRVRHNQWKYVDYEGDGDLDLVIAIEDWTGYGWDNAFDPLGKWKNEPLHGLIYLLENRGGKEKPEYTQPKKLLAGGKTLDVFGTPSPCFADFDSDGDLDLICGEFLDGFTYFENTGSRQQPIYAPGTRLMSQGKPLLMDLQMIVVTALDWDSDGDTDLVVGQEDGRVALVENTGDMKAKAPAFLPPKFFQQEADCVKFGALATPVAVDLDGDGDDDIVSGNTAGYIGWVENQGGSPSRWAPPQLLKSNGQTFRIMAGPNGSIQGPAEAKWGYTTLSVHDWDADGLPDLIFNSIWGKVEWMKNLGPRKSPVFSSPHPLTIRGKGEPPYPDWNWWKPQQNQFVTQWRTTPLVADWNRDGKPDLIMLDHEGYLAFFERTASLKEDFLLPGKRVFHAPGGAAFDRDGKLVAPSPGPLRLNPGIAGKSGRRKLSLADWDDDGLPDLLVNSKNADWFKNQGMKDGVTWFQPMGPMHSKPLAGHDTSPTTIKLEGKERDLLIGAEDGYFYYMKKPGR
ncbi:MAG: VCBS repeat-containing protein [Gemmataceae bacterium]|nr:VCBS repeat-containing protein [Gemmataceae bacterium]